MRCEILIDPEMFPRGARMLEAMIATAPVPVRVRRTYVGDCQVLMVYGTGHPGRRPWQLKHLQKGGHLIGWDLGYWQREVNGTFTMRATLDADHPQRFIRAEPPERWDAAGIKLRSDADPAGPVIVVGMGPKANRAHGLRPLAWEARAAAAAAKTGREVVYRPKRPGDPKLPGLRVLPGPIEEALKGASLVVCRHSNVAIDACIAGVPVVCDDGAAAALYRGKVPDPTIPTREERLAFLRGLAWWQWTPNEAKDAWIYLLGRLSA